MVSVQGNFNPHPGILEGLTGRAQGLERPKHNRIIVSLLQPPIATDTSANWFGAREILRRHVVQVVGKGILVHKPVCGQESFSCNASFEIIQCSELMPNKPVVQEEPAEEPKSQASNKATSPFIEVPL